MAEEKVSAEKETSQEDKTVPEGEENPEGTKASSEDVKTSEESAPYYPEGLPEHMRGKTDQETIDKVSTALDGFRKEQSKKGKEAAPETADGYELALPDDLKDKIVAVDKDGKDPVFEAMKPTLHKLGITNEGATQLVTELYKTVSAQKTAMDEAAANDPAAADLSFKQLGGEEKAKPLQDASNAWILGIKEKLGLDDADVQELQYLTCHSQGLKVLNKLRGLTSEKSIPADFSQGEKGKLITQADIEALQNSDEYQAGDQSAHDKVRDLITLKQAQTKKAS